MIRQFIKDIVADLTNAVARSELVAENARLRGVAEDLEKSCDRYSEDNADLRAKLEAAERRCQVDRSAAIEAVLAKLGFMSRDEACEAVDAVLGSAKAEAEAGSNEVERLKEQRRWAWDECDKLRAIAECSVNFTKAASAALSVIEGWDPIKNGGAMYLAEAVARAVLGAAKIGSPAFTPVPTGEYASPDVLTRIRTLISAASSPTDAAPRIYRLIAADHAAAVKRARELEVMVTAEHDRASDAAHENMRLSAECERLKGILDNQRNTIADLNRETAERTGRNAKLATDLEEVNKTLALKCQKVVRLQGELHERGLEVERLKAEVARLSAPCPADGMSDKDVSIKISTALYHNNDGWADHEAGGAAARALFGRPAR